MSRGARIRVGVSSSADLIRHGLRQLLSTHPSGVFVLDDGPPAQWTPATVDVVVLDLTHRRPPPAGHFTPAWAHRIPTFGLVASGGDEHRAATVLGCHESLALGFSAAELDAAASTMRDMAHGVSLAEPARLTWRELQVVHLVANGDSNQDLARRLHIGENTVKTYIRQAYRKMRVSTRSQATVWAHLNSVASESAGATLFAGSGARETGLRLTAS